MLIGLAATLALVAANGFFVATEFAVTRLRPTQVEEFERQSRPGAGSVRHAVDHIDAYLAACQLGITLASLGLGVVGEPVFHDLLEPIFGDQARVLGVAVAGGLAFAIITLLHVVLGELSPKSLSIARTERTALLVAPPMRVFYLLARPLVDLFNALGNLVLKPFGIPPARDVGHAPHSEEEILTLVGQSQQEGLIQSEERTFAENVFTFGDRRAREIMVPRPEVEQISTAEDVQAAMEQAVRTGHTRFPLCEPEKGLDGAVGILNAKDLLTAALGDGESDLRDLARPLHRFPESVLLDELLREMRRRSEHLMLVVDEHGTAVGIVTMEDILEEIVGEIEDEFDTAEAELIRRDGPVALVGGAAPLRLVKEQLGLDLTDSQEATIGGHLVERLGRLPGVGEQTTIDGHRIEVSGVEGGRVTELRVTPAEHTPDEGAEEDEESAE